MPTFPYSSFWYCTALNFEIVYMANMLNSTTQNRKNLEEYCDPDYDLLHLSSLKTLSVDNTYQKNEGLTHSTNDLRGISTVITQIFHNEKIVKQQQLTEVDKRLDVAGSLLERIRIGIVEQYYRKQELLVHERDAAAVRGKVTLFEEELHGLQKGMHPAPKYIIAKRPKKHCNQLPEIGIQRRIREKGLIINNSENECNQWAIAVQSIKAKLHNENAPQTSSHPDIPNCAVYKKAKGNLMKKINVARLNNKTKHMIVIGNTSTYVGQNNDTVSKKQPHGGNILTHKWLVYLQSREPKYCLESFIKKVSFHLHPSYRPNDVVDVFAAPFQISRRGWGEFPIRIQLYFHDNLKQKPVQIIHNIVLDRTLSGMHTLGAETLLEIWLRTGAVIERHMFSNNITIPGNFKALSELKNKMDTLSAKSLNNNTLTISNIYKKDYLAHLMQNFRGLRLTLQPEKPLENNSESRVKVICKMKERLQSILEEPVQNLKKNLNGFTFGYNNKTGVPPSHILNTVCEKSDISKLSAPKKSKYHHGLNKGKSMHTTFSSAMQLEINSHKKESQRNNNNIIALSRIGKLVPLKVTTPNVQLSQVKDDKIAREDILQKKLVQLIGTDGKQKCLQVLVADKDNCHRTEVPGLNRINVAIQKTGPKMILPRKSGKEINSSAANLTKKNASKEEKQNIVLKHSLPSHSKSITTQLNYNTPKQIVFQKEGKLFIIDPLKMKLKQERVNQISLLKPQKSWQREYQQQSHAESVQSKVLQSMMSDHDYTSSVINRSLSNSTTSTRIGKDLEFINTLKESEPKLVVENPHAEVKNYFHVLQQRHIQFEQKFLSRNFVGVKFAVDYILRHLPLISQKNSLALSFSFTCQSLKDFDTLPVMKQRACEWLRAKYVTYFLRNHQYLKELNYTNKELFWSTREVLVYARYHGFTPKMKIFDASNSFQPQSPLTDSIHMPQLNHDQPNNKKVDNSTQQKCLRQSVKLEQNHFHFESLTPKYRITSWLHEANLMLEIEKTSSEYDNISIDIVNTPKTITRVASTFHQLCDSRQLNFLQIPDHLSDGTMLVSNFFSDLNMKVSPDFVNRDTTFSFVHSVMAHCLNVFLEKLVRRTVASKHNALIAESLHVTKGDIAKILVGHAEFDFLTIKNFGIAECDL